MENTQRFSALETRTSVGVQTNMAMLFLAHIVGEYRNVQLRVSEYL